MTRRVLTIVVDIFIGAGAVFAIGLVIITLIILVTVKVVFVAVGSPRAGEVAIVILRVGFKVWKVHLLKVPDPRMVENLNELDSLLWVLLQQLVDQVFVLGGHLGFKDDTLLLPLGELRP